MYAHSVNTIVYFQPFYNCKFVVSLFITNQKKFMFFELFCHHLLKFVDMTHLSPQSSKHFENAPAPAIQSISMCEVRQRDVGIGVFNARRNVERVDGNICLHTHTHTRHPDFEEKTVLHNEPHSIIQFTQRSRREAVSEYTCKRFGSITCTHVRTNAHTHRI